MNWKISPQFSNKIFWLVLLCGALLSLLGFKVATQLDNHNRQLEQQFLTQMISNAVHTDLAVYIALLNSVRGLFIASPHVTREVFSSFASSELENHHSIQALEWIPYIKKSQLKTYQQQAVQDGLFNFNITELNEDGRLIPAGQREAYFPVYYIEPLKGNEAALGFDLASSKQRQATMQQARLSRKIQATASITLVQETAHQKGFLVFLPVFKHKNSLKTQQQAPLLGYVLGVFRITDLFNAAVQTIENKLSLLDIELIDHTDPDHPQQLMLRQNLTDSSTLKKPSLQITRNIHFVGRNWTLSTYATSEFIAQHRSFTSWLVLITGFIITLIITAYIRSLIINETRIRTIVNKRTSELQSSEQLNLKIVEHIIDALITIDARGRITRFNPAAVNMFGYTEQEAIGKNVKMLMPEPYHSEHDNYLLHHQQTGEKRIIGIGKEATAQHKNGRVFPVHLSVGETQLNGKPLYVGTITDLTKLKNNELEMVQFSNRLNLATQAGSIGVWDYNLINFELEWDDRMYEIYGVNKEDFANPYKAFQQAVHPDDRQQAEAEFVEAMKGGIQFDTEFRIIWPNGEVRYIHASAVSQFDTQGHAYRMTGINMDITERKLTEQSMLQAKQVAEEASRQKSAFLNVMSHELRTPLTVILGYLPLLKNLHNMPPPETIKQIADDMDFSGQHLIEMINDLLDISKIEAGQLNLSPVETRSLPLLQEMITKFENMASQKNIKLVIDMEDFSFKVDTLRLRQILINLIGNALKFTQQGQIIISAWRDASFATFRIKDTGIGIPESALPFIFDAFHQVDNSSTRTAGGTGLGLAITQRLVNLHGGTIMVESRPESGTTFTFTIKQEKG